MVSKKKFIPNKEFHKIYGSRKDTRDQLKEYLNQNHE